MESGAIPGAQSRNISQCLKICSVDWVGQGHLEMIFSVIGIGNWQFALKILENWPICFKVDSKACTVLPLGHWQQIKYMEIKQRITLCAGILTNHLSAIYLLFFISLNLEKCDFSVKQMMFMSKMLLEVNCPWH